MRVAYVCADPGIPVFGRKGASIHVQEVVRALRKLGCEVELFVTRLDGAVPPGLEGLRIHRLPAPDRRVDAAAREQAALAANDDLLLALERCEGFDFVYERYSLWSRAGMAFAQAQGIPGILEVNSPLIEEQSRHRHLHHVAEAEQVARDAFGAATAIVAVSDAVARYVEGFPGAAGRVHVVPNGVDVDRFAAAETPLLPDADGAFVVGFVGTLKAWHGMETLVDAFCRVHDQLPQARLLIVGDGPLRDTLAAELARNGCLDRATFTGAVDHDAVPGWLASMDVAVAPYPDLPDFYFSPLKLYEYMAAGLPVVASGIGQIADIVDDGRNGLLVRPGSAHDLADAILCLALDPAMAARLGAAAGATVRTHHTWDAVARRILALAVTGPVTEASAAAPRKRNGDDASLRATLPGLWQIVQRFRAPLRQQWRLLLLAFVAMFGTIGLRLIEPWPLKFVVDYLSGAAAPFLPAGQMAVLTAAAGAIVVAVAGRALLSYVSTVALAQAGMRVTVQIRADLYQHLLALPMSYFQRTRSAELLTAVVGDIGRLQDVAVSALLPLLVSVLTLVGMVLIMLWMNWQLTLLALFAFPLAWLAMRRYSGQIRTAARRQRKREAALASAANEAFGAMRVVKVFGLNDELGRAFAGVNSKESKEDVRSRRLAARMEREVDIFIAAGTAISVWYGALLVTNGSLTLGDLIVFLSYLKTAFRPLQDMAKYTGRIAKAVASGERVIALLDEPAEYDAAVTAPAPPLHGEIVFDHVSFGYTPDRPVLRDVSFTAAPGECVALVGPSGAGKSSLAALLGRFYDPDAGRILIDGHDVRDLTRASLRSQISMVFQDSLLFGVSVADNIRYGNLDADETAIATAARRANAHDFVSALDAGYATELGERGSTLSGGQQRRIAIARAAVRRALIVVLDEPTTGLDKENEHLVHAALDELTRSATTILITHELERARTADQILYLENGEICERGTHDDLLALGGRYAAMYALQYRNHGDAAAAPGALARPAVFPAMAGAHHAVVR